MIGLRQLVDLRNEQLIVNFIYLSYFVSLQELITSFQLLPWKN